MNLLATGRLRHLPPAVLLAGLTILGGSAVVQPAEACAAPREWDIGAYDQCIADGIGKGYDSEEWENHKALCCWATGGDWNAVRSECQAPPAEPAQRPWAVDPGELPVHTLEPAAPPLTRIPLSDITTTQGLTS